MNKHWARITLAFLAIILLPMPFSHYSHAESKLASGDGSGIGGTGNSPGGSGMGGTGTREQKLPDTLPDLPEAPEPAEVPEAQLPDIPENTDTTGAGALPEPPEVDVPAGH